MLWAVRTSVTRSSSVLTTVRGGAGVTCGRAVVVVDMMFPLVGDVAVHGGAPTPAPEYLGVPAHGGEVRRTQASKAPEWVRANEGAAETDDARGGRAPRRRAMRENVTPTPDERRSRAGDEDTAATTGGRAVGPAGRYVLGALLGRGGMADVYRATDRTLGRDVAVKLMRERTTDTTERARFVAEAQILARLSHPNLVTILDAGISDEHPFLVLELVVGSSLSTALKQSGRGLPADRVRHIGAQIAAALAHSHAAGIVHRDVKPGNILLGTGGRALLTDFGISRLLDGHAQHTRTGHTIGTASYMAPEQVHGDDLTPAVDLYALGLVLLEAYTGRREYEGTPIEAAIARLHRSPHLPTDLPPALAGVLAGLTQTDPTLRPSAVDTEHALTSGPPSGWAATGGAGSTTPGPADPGRSSRTTPPAGAGAARRSSRSWGGQPPRWWGLPSPWSPRCRPLHQRPRPARPPGQRRRRHRVPARVPGRRPRRTCHPERPPREQQARLPGLLRRAAGEAPARARGLAQSEHEPAHPRRPRRSSRTSGPRRPSGPSGPSRAAGTTAARTSRPPASVCRCQGHSPCTGTAHVPASRLPNTQGHHH